jgi:hypothetical protein
VEGRDEEKWGPGDDEEGSRGDAIVNDSPHTCNVKLKLEGSFWL